MTDREAFEAATRADPRAGTHLIYADWLDERDRPALAGALRGQWGEPIAWALSRQPLLNADDILGLLNGGWVPAYWPGFAAFAGTVSHPDRHTILSFRPPGAAEAVYRAAVAVAFRSSAARFLGCEPGATLCEGRDVAEEEGFIRVIDRFRWIWPQHPARIWREAYPQEEFAPLFPAGADLSEPPALWMPPEAKKS